MASRALICSSVFNTATWSTTSYDRTNCLKPMASSVATLGHEGTTVCAAGPGVAKPLEAATHDRGERDLELLHDHGRDQRPNNTQACLARNPASFTNFVKPVRPAVAKEMFLSYWIQTNTVTQVHRCVHTPPALP